MIHRVEKCFGLPLWKGRRYVEIFVCFSGVAMHIHPGQASEIIPLFGWSNFSRVQPDGIVDTVKISPRQWFRAFTVPANWLHWFNTKFLIFLNVSDRSAAENIRYV